MLKRIACVLVLFAGIGWADSLDQAVDSYLATEPLENAVAAEPAAGNPWDFELNLGFTSSQGNTEATTFTGGFTLKNEWDRWSIQFNLLSVYQENDGVEAANRHSFVERYNRKISEKGSLYQDLLLEHDALEDLKIRITATVGYRHELMKKMKGEEQVFIMHGELGVGVLHENFSSGEETNAIADVGLSWTWKITKHLTYEQVIKWWPNLEDVEDYRLRWVSKFTTPIGDRWNASLEINDKYNNNPPDGNKHNDLLIAFYLSYKFTADKEG